MRRTFKLHSANAHISQCGTANLVHFNAVNPWLCTTILCTSEANGPHSRHISEMHSPNQSVDQKQQSFLRLFIAREPEIRGFVRSLVPTAADSNDVMQEAAIVLWQKFNK